MSEVLRCAYRPHPDIGDFRHIGACNIRRPEEGDQTVVNPRLIVNPDWIVVEGHHPFLITAATEGHGLFAAQVSPGFDHEVPRLLQILNRPEGLLPRPRDLPEPSSVR